ncbi:hypothetical protein MMC29_000962 [Sticta canariensis]|nr:hypothetical protein [Sticta canariensis]
MPKQERLKLFDAFEELAVKLYVGLEFEQVETRLRGEIQNMHNDLARKISTGGAQTADKIKRVAPGVAERLLGQPPKEGERGKQSHRVRQNPDLGREPMGSKSGRIKLSDSIGEARASEALVAPNVSRIPALAAEKIGYMGWLKKVPPGQEGQTTVVVKLRSFEVANEAIQKALVWDGEVHAPTLTSKPSVAHLSNAATAERLATGQLSVNTEI